MTALAHSGSATLSPITTADQLAAAWLLGYSDTTRKAYSADLRKWAAWLAGLEVEPLAAHRSHVEAWVRGLEDAGSSRATIARHLAVLSGFYGYALDEAVIVRNPVVRVRRPKIDDHSPRLGLDQAEIAAFLHAAADNPRDHALACLLTLNGLRVSEALGVDLESLSTERGHRTVTIIRKGARQQLVPLAPRTLEAVELYAGERDAGPLFATASGRRIDRQQGWKIVRAVAKRAGITKTISPHSLRHSFVTAALDAGASLRDVQDAAGHADPRTTRRYDRGRHSLDRHPTYAVTAKIAAASHG